VRVKAADVVNAAYHQVGFRESPPKSNRGPQVDLYTGGRAEPWCAHFIAWLFRALGDPLPGDVAPTPKRANPLASVSFTERVFSEHGWLVMMPQVGDLIFYKDRGQSDPGRGRHIGLVVAVTGDTVRTVEGNWGDAVVHRTLRRGDPRISGYGRPPYA